MATDQIQIPWGVTAATLTARLWNRDSQIWDIVIATPAFVAYSTANIANYVQDISANELGTASGVYTYTIPSTVAAGVYRVDVVLGDGSAEGQAVVWEVTDIEWDGSTIVTVNDILDTAIPELGVAAPTATPTLRTGLMLLYMALRNKLVVQTSGTDALEVYNDAGTKIASKLLTDDSSDYTESKMS